MQLLDSVENVFFDANSKRNLCARQKTFLAASASRMRCGRSHTRAARHHGVRDPLCRLPRHFRQPTFRARCSMPVPDSLKSSGQKFQAIESESSWPEDRDQDADSLQDTTSKIHRYRFATPVSSNGSKIRNVTRNRVTPVTAQSCTPV